MAKKPEYEIEDWQVAYNNAQTDEEREKAISDYTDAKQRNACRREQYILDRAVESSQRRKAKLKKVATSLEGIWQKVAETFSAKSR